MNEPVDPRYYMIEHRSYRVCAEFSDFDGGLHPVGETWTYLGRAFLPYDDGLTWFVRMSDGGEHQIRMQWRDDAQGPIIDRIDRYLVAAD